ncbi:hypothetical protein CKA32_007094 [Geitlerinema sp. FC II]|nr:hypothetical protein CKA32_007094 [Geitlerinema sp. FC II]
MCLLLKICKTLLSRPGFLPNFAIANNNSCYFWSGYYKNLEQMTRAKATKFKNSL